MTDNLLDRLQLREIAGKAATLEMTATGFLYADHGRQYRLMTSATGVSTMGLIEGWAFGTYHAISGDVSLSWSRRELAAALARDNAALIEEVRRDLFRFQAAIRFVAIDMKLLDGLENDPAPAELPPRPRLICSGRPRGARKGRRTAG